MGDDLIETFEASTGLDSTMRPCRLEVVAAYKVRALYVALKRASDIIPNVAPGHFPKWEEEAREALAQVAKLPMTEEA